jgi:hypothetical protein
MTKLSEADEFKLRVYLWLSHGHAECLYGDDGEMQCQTCMKFGVWDYKRDNISKLINAAIRSREELNFELLFNAAKEDKS